MLKYFFIQFLCIFTNTQVPIQKNYLLEPDDYFIHDEPYQEIIIGEAMQEFVQYFDNQNFLDKQNRQKLQLNNILFGSILSIVYENFRYLLVVDNKSLNFYLINSLDNSLILIQKLKLTDIVEELQLEFQLQNVHYYKDNFILLNIQSQKLQNIYLLEFDIEKEGIIVKKNIVSIFKLEQEKKLYILLKNDYLFLYTDNKDPYVCRLNLKDQSTEQFDKNFEGHQIQQGQLSFVSDQFYFVDVDQFLYFFDFKEIQKIELDEKIKLFSLDLDGYIRYINDDSKFKQYISKDEQKELFSMDSSIKYCQYFQETRQEDFFYCYNDNTHFFYSIKQGEIQTIQNNKKFYILKYPQLQKYLFFYVEDQELFLMIKFVNNLHYKIKITSNNNYCPYYITDCSLTKLKFNNYIAFIYTVNTQEKYVLLKKQNLQITYNKFSFEDHYLYLREFLFGYVQDFSLVDLKEQKSFHIEKQTYLQIYVEKNNNFYNRFLQSQNFIIYASVIYTGYFKRNYTIILKYYNINVSYSFQENTTPLDTQIQEIITLNIFKNDVFVIYKKNDKFHLCSFLYYEYQNCKPNEIFSDEFFNSGQIKFFMNRNQTKNLSFTFWKQEQNQIIFFEFTTEDVTTFKSRTYRYQFKNKIIDVDSINIENNTILCFQDQDNIYVVNNTNKKNLLVEEKLNRKFYINKQYFIVIDCVKKQVIYRDWKDLELIQKQLYFASKFEFLQTSNLVQFVGSFVVVKILKNDGSQYLASIEISDKNPYFSFEYVKYDSSFKKHDYSCIEESCMFFVFSEQNDRDKFYVITGSYWLKYNLGLKDFDSKEYQNLWNQDIVYQYALQFNENCFQTFSERLNVQIAGSFIITNSQKGRILQINSGYKAETYLLKYFEGNVFNIALGIDEQQDLNQWSIMQTEEKGYSIYNIKLNIQFDFMPFMFIPTQADQQLLQFTRSKVLSVYRSVSEDDIYYILREDGYLVSISLKNSQNYINDYFELSVKPKDQIRQVDIKQCEKLNVYKKIVFVECFEDLYWGDLNQAFQRQIELVSYDISNKTNYDGNIVKIEENVMVLVEKKDNEKKLKLLKLENTVFVEIDQPLDLDDMFFKDKLFLQILFPEEDKIIIAVFSGQNNIFFLLKDFNLVFRTNPSSVENKWISFKKNQCEYEIICLQQNTALVYKFEIYGNYLDIEIKETIQLELITNREYLDYFYDKGYLFVLSFEHTLNSASISVQHYDGQIVSYQNYESSQQEKTFFLHYDRDSENNESVFVTSSINFFNQIFINWDYVIRNSSKEGRFQLNDLVF